MTWRVLEESDTDIKRNLAVEEALARVNAASKEKVNTLRFWKSDRAVVIGRLQCVHLEANIDFCQQNDVTITRRFTGGGAVYHDLGNLNVTLCMDQRESYVARSMAELYWNFFGGVSSCLRDIGIPARFDSDRSCLRVNGKKITGTAGWLKEGVSFIHGTLLISSDLKMLTECLRAPPDQPRYMRDKSRIRCKESKRDTVTTITNEVGISPSEAEIRSAIIGCVEKISEEDMIEGELTQEERDTAESLYQTRYRLSEWNLGTPIQEHTDS